MSELTNSPLKLAFDDVERLVDELRLAQELQQSMMPKLPPMLDWFEIAATWLPANEMSGDFYDFIPIDSDRWGIALGDVMGKGMSAAMVMALARSALRMVTKTADSPQSVLAALNQQLLGDMAHRTTVSLIYGVLDSYQRTLTLANAGAPYPLVLNANGECVVIEIGGFPLRSTTRGFDYVEETIDLTPNSAIVLYSDGIDEAQRDDDEMYGFSRLPDIISSNRNLNAKDLVDVILQDVLHYTGRVRQDDMTLVVIKAKEGVPSAGHLTGSRAYQLVPESLKSQVRKEQGKVEGERAVVTLLTVDVSQWAASSADKVRGATDAIAAIIFKHEGFVNRVFSNELSGFFGAPIRHTNDAESALHAAIEIRDTLHRMSHEPNVAGEVKIALYTGPVVISDISGEVVEYAQVEPLFKSIGALVDKATPGEIWVDETTYKLTRANFDFSLLAPMEIESSGRALQPYRLYDRRTLRSFTRSDGTFLRHEAQLRRLQAYANELITSGKGKIISLVGSAGVGKHQLMAEFKESLGDQVMWVTNHFTLEKRRSSYAVFVPIIQRILNIDGFDRLNPTDSISVDDLSLHLTRELQTLYQSPITNHQLPVTNWVFSVDEMVAYFKAVLLADQPLDDKIATLPYDQLQRQTFVAIRDVLIAAAHRKPCVLALSDLPWIDDVSKNLMTFLIEYIDDFSDTPILLLCLSHSQDWWLSDLVMKIAPNQYENIVLEWMSLEEISAFLDYLLPGKGVPETLKTQILRRASGNPFHLSQIVKFLLADQALVNQNDEWLVMEDIDSIFIPNTLEGVLRARIDRLNVNAREILQYAAVLGAVLNLDLLRQMADFIPHLDYHLQNLQKFRFLPAPPQSPPILGGKGGAEEDSPIDRLERTLIANIVYASIPQQERLAHHGWIAQRLEEQSGHQPEYYEVLAYHYARSHKKSKAIEYLIKAGHRARRCFNNIDAIAFYEQALDLIRGSGSAEPVLIRMREIYEGLGDAFKNIGRYRDALTSYQKWLELDSADASPSLFTPADIKHKIAEVYTRQSAWKDALEYLKSAQEDLPSPRPLPRPLSETERGENSPFPEGKGAGGLGPGHVSPSELLGEINYHIGVVYSQQGDLTGAIRASQQGLATLRESDSPDVWARVHGQLEVYYTKAGDLPSAEKHLLASIEYANRGGNRYLLSLFYNDLGVIARASNRLDEAIEYYEKSIQIKTQLKYLDGLSRSYFSLAMIDLEIEDWENALIHLKDALKYTAHGSSSDKFIGDLHVSIANVYQRLGHIDLAIAHYQKNIDIRIQAGDTIGGAVGQEYLCQAYLAKGELDAAMEVCTESLKTAEMLNLNTLAVRNYIDLALIHRAKGEWEDTIENLEIALVVAAKVDDGRAMAQIHRHLAETHLQTPPDPQSHPIHLAEVHFYEALGLLEQIDAQTEIEEIHRVMEGHGLA